MKFNMVNLGYRSTPDYPYNYRIELVDYTLDEWTAVYAWLADLKIPRTFAGRDVIYLRKKDATMFALRYT